MGQVMKLSWISFNSNLPFPEETSRALQRVQIAAVDPFGTRGEATLGATVTIGIFIYVLSIQVSTSMLTISQGVACLTNVYNILPLGVLRSYASLITTSFLICCYADFL